MYCLTCQTLYEITPRPLSPLQQIKLLINQCITNRLIKLKFVNFSVCRITII